MTSEKAAEYMEMYDRLKSLTSRNEIELLMDRMDDLWLTMSASEIAEVEASIRDSKAG